MTINDQNDQAVYYAKLQAVMVSARVTLTKHADHDSARLERRDYEMNPSQQFHIEREGAAIDRAQLLMDANRFEDAAQELAQYGLVKLELFAQDEQLYTPVTPFLVINLPDASTVGRPVIYTEPRKPIVLNLATSLLAELDEQAPRGKRTQWIEAAIREKLARDE